VFLSSVLSPQSSSLFTTAMTLSDLLNLVPVYVLVLVRVAAMMVYAPLLGSGQIPKRVKGMIACVLALAVARGVPPPIVPVTSLGMAAVGIGGEIAFGLAMGLILSFTFIAAQWAGQIVGQQMGLNLSEVFDPQFGGQGSIVGNLYFMLTLVVFLTVNGHRAMIMGVRDSFDAMPLLSVGITKSLVDVFLSLFQAATELAIRLAAPILVTMVVVDMALGFIGKTMPQLNVMSAGLSIRVIVGMLVLLFGIGLTSEVMRTAVLDSMETVYRLYVTSGR
ncbi:MAG TPA: flagellar biosynthetic protein FliR, partial [Tepidisphaeraceae bacterium]|nr:flagellar biosynthetic protein FliR [Tepidisphaeraceae bacterium]